MIILVQHKTAPVPSDFLNDFFFVASVNDNIPLINLNTIFIFLGRCIAVSGSQMPTTLLLAMPLDNHPYHSGCELPAHFLRYLSQSE